MMADFGRKKEEILKKHLYFHEKRDHSTDDAFARLYPESPLKLSKLIEQADSDDILKSFHPPRETYQRKIMKKPKNNSFTYGETLLSPERVERKQKYEGDYAKREIKKLLSDLNAVPRKKAVRLTARKEGIFKTMVRAERLLESPFDL